MSQVSTHVQGTPVDHVSADGPGGLASGWMSHLIITVAAACLWLTTFQVGAASIGYIVSKSDQGLVKMAALGVGHVAGAVTLLCIIPYRQRVYNWLICCGQRLASGRALCLLLGAVVVVRVAWILLVPTQPFSDGAIYHDLALGILESGEYGVPGKRAFWPPGYPLMLAGLYAVFGVNIMVAKLAAVFLAVLSECACWIWLRRYADKATAGLGTLLLALWPSRTFHLDILTYDDLVIACILLGLAVMPDVRGRTASLWRWVACGLLLGVGCLARGQVVLVLPAIALWLCLRSWPIRAIAWRILLMVLGIAAVLGPWAFRNHRELGHAIIFTSNAGCNVFFGVTEDGSYSKESFEMLKQRVGHRDDEIAFSNAAMQLGLQAVQNDPVAVAKRIVVDKPIHYYGSDNAIAWLESYEAIWPRHGWLAKAVKATALALSNCYYVLLMLGPLLFVRRARATLSAYPSAVFCIAFFMTGLVVHSLFLAQSRYHLMYLPFWTMAVAMLLRSGDLSGRRA